MTFRSKSKKKLNTELRQEWGFVNEWAEGDRPKAYDPLLDKHNLYFFQLPTVQKHLRKLKKKMRKGVETVEKEELMQKLEKNSIIFGKKKPTSVKKIDYEPQSPRYYRHNTEVTRSLSHKQLARVAEERPRFTVSKKILPHVNSRVASPGRAITERDVDRDNMMEMIIRRRLGTAQE